MRFLLERALHTSVVMVVMVVTFWLSACTRPAGTPGDAWVGAEDSGVLDAEADGTLPDVAAEPCDLAVQEGCADPGAPFLVQLQATGGLRFLALGGNDVILAERPLPEGEGSTPVVVMAWGWDAWLEAGLVSPQGPVSALGIMALSVWAGTDGVLMGDEVFGFTAVTLGCESAGCRLYGVELGTVEPYVLTALPGGELPAGAVPRGLMRRPWSPAGEPEVCAFGEGMWCFDGIGWRELMSNQYAPRLNDATVLPDGRLCAVGDAGEVWRWEGTSWTIFPDPIIDNDLLRVKTLVSEDGFIAVGTHGALLTGNDALWVLSNIAGDDVVGAARSTMDGELRVVLRGGCVARVDLGGEPPVIQSGTCFYDSAAPSPVIDFDSGGVGTCGLWKALTADYYLTASAGCTE